MIAHCRVAEAGVVVQERFITKERDAGGEVAAFSTKSLSFRRKRKPSKGEREEKKTAYDPHCLGTRQLLFAR